MDKELREKLRRWRPKLNEFANHVRQARLDAGIKQIDLAQAVGKPRLWLAKRENGWNRMRIPESEMLRAAIARMKAS
jgi:DNA-binding XRE family transcriptional regulator